MLANFQNQESDYEAFYLHFLRSSEQGKKIQFRLWLAIGVVCLLTFLISWIFARWFIAAPIGLVPAVVYYFWGQTAMHNEIVKRMATQHSRTQYPHLYAPMKLRVKKGAGLWLECGNQRAEVRWPEMTSAQSSDNHVFVFKGEQIMFIIPKKDFTTQEGCSWFQDRVNKKVEGNEPSCVLS